MLTYQVNPDGVSGLYYLYDSRDRLVEVTPLEYSPAIGDYYSLYGEERAAYTYDSQNRLSQISTGTSTYNLTYDTYGNVTEINVGGKTLASYTYRENNGKLTSMEYGNGPDVAYYYDELDRIVKICYNGVERYLYQYTADGKLHSVEDIASNVGYLYSYDGDDRVDGYTQYSLSDKVNTLAINYKYDEKSRLFEAITTTDYFADSNKADWRLLEQFLYHDDTDLLTNYLALFTNTQGNSLAGVFAYDAVQRLTTKNYALSKGTASVQNQISYTYDDATNKYGSRIETYTTTIGSNTTTYTYSYDSNGNIVRIIDSTLGSANPVKYTYDDLNQLIREDNPYLGESYVYTYDYNGNRTSKKTYSYTTGTLGIIIDTDTYLYESALWGDGLSGYYNSTVTEDDYFIIYDNIGNPLSYYVNGNSCSLTWTDGRRLSKVELSNGAEYTFTYNDEGIRTSKTVNGVTHYYTLNGTQILTEQWQDKFVAYIYDETGAPIGMQYRTSSYAEDVFDYFYFEKNLQGDIVSVYNGNGVKLISYVYDAWGNFETYTHTTNIGGAQYNPFRYRGYYYDTELGLYYLNSRYYDSNTGRFLNADGQLNQQDGIVGLNMFAYCINNPVNGSDPCGTCFHHWKFWKDCAKCAALKAEQKAQEAAQTIKYDVPLYKQGRLSLCWAFCQTMMESYNTGTKLTQKEAKTRAIEIAQNYHGSTTRKVWNQGGWPANLGKRVGNINSIEELYNILQKNGPVYAYYSTNESAHIVIVTGVNLYSGVVYTNNPWGVSGVQSFEKFQNGFATKWYHFSSGKSTSGAIIYLMD